MQIIVISDRLAKARSVCLSARHVFASGLVGLALLGAATLGLYWVTLRYASELRIPLVERLVLATQQTEAQRSREFMQQNLNAMAAKLGEMQAQLTRLDALGERLAALAGIKTQEWRFSELPGVGGAAPTLLPPQDLSFGEVSERVSQFSRNVENRTDMLGVLEAELFERAVKAKQLPTMVPVQAPYISSGFGPRIDPFTGQSTMHEGVDFPVASGTPVVAAAGGVVRFAGYNAQAGYMIDIDHGNDLLTRYVHLSKLLVKEGDVVLRGRRIALSGSSGRATGPNLHFEVRYRGAAQNPLKFLAAANPPALAQSK